MPDSRSAPTKTCASQSIQTICNAQSKSLKSLHRIRSRNERLQLKEGDKALTALVRPQRPAPNPMYRARRTPIPGRPTRAGIPLPKPRQPAPHATGCRSGCLVNPRSNHSADHSPAMREASGCPRSQSRSFTVKVAQRPRGSGVPPRWMPRSPRTVGLRARPHRGGTPLPQRLGRKGTEKQ